LADDSSAVGKRLFLAGMICYKCNSLIGYVVSDQDIEFAREMAKLNILTLCMSCKRTKILSYEGAEE
jgi:hypothetical protein